MTEQGTHLIYLPFLHSLIESSIVDSPTPRLVVLVSQKLIIWLEQLETKVLVQTTTKLHVCLHSSYHTTQFSPKPTLTTPKWLPNCILGEQFLELQHLGAVFWCMLSCVFCTNSTHAVTEIHQVTEYIFCFLMAIVSQARPNQPNFCGCVDHFRVVVYSPSNAQPQKLQWHTMNINWVPDYWYSLIATNQQLCYHGYHESWPSLHSYMLNVNHKESGLLEVSCLLLL